MRLPHFWWAITTQSLDPWEEMHFLNGKTAIFSGLVSVLFSAFVLHGHKATCFTGPARSWPAVPSQGTTQKWKVESWEKKTPQKTQKTPHHAQRHGHANTGSRTPIIRACLSIEIPPTSLLLHLAKSFQRTKGCDTEASAGPDSSLHLSLPTSAGDPGLMRSHARAPLSPACT